MNYEPILRLLFVWYSGFLLLIFTMLFLSGGKMIIYEPSYTIRSIEFIVYSLVFLFSIHQLWLLKDRK